MERLYVPELLSGLTLEAGPGGLRAIRFGLWDAAEQPGPVVEETARQLREYFGGARQAFDLPLDLVGTAFQVEVWRALMAIPFGQTASYRDIAEAVGRSKGFQAIGQANTRNPVPIVVPCHRVIQADGSIGGYGGGVDRKRLLLGLEARATGSEMSGFLK